MKYYQLVFALLAAGITACKTHRQVSVAGDGADSAAVSGPILRLSFAGRPEHKDSVILAFTVSNHSDTIQRFCKWDTPFEPLMGKYLSITDKNGMEAQYKGAMAKRRMPPPAESFITVNPHDSVRATLNLMKAYEVLPGNYSIKYIGSGMSGLIPKNQLNVNVTQ